MNPIRLNRSAAPLHRTIVGYTALAVAVLGFISVASARTLEEAGAATPVALTQAMNDLSADYRQQQWQRLAQKKDRDSLIAAVLLGMPNDAGQAPIDGNAAVEQHLAKAFGHDPLALFALALSCQMQYEYCAHPEYYDALVRIAPDNAVHWLLLPKHATPSDAQLHSAATATQADSHLRDIFRIVRTALANQPAPSTRSGVDPRELALLLRNNAVDQVRQPDQYGALLKMCKAAIAQRRDDCIAIGRLLEEDRSGSILSRMIGSTALRRLEKGTPEEAAGKEMRREQVWLSEKLAASDDSRMSVPYQEQLHNEVVAFGEWEAWQRAVERMGKTRTPPAGWMPQDPQLLLTSDERTPAPAQ